MKQKVPAPRNPYAAAAKMKNAGKHGKSEKAIRRAEKVQLRRLGSAESEKGLLNHKSHVLITQLPPVIEHSCKRQRLHECFML